MVVSAPRNALDSDEGIYSLTPLAVSPLNSKTGRTDNRQSKIIEEMAGMCSPVLQTHAKSQPSRPLLAGGAARWRCCAVLPGEQLY